MAACVMQRGRTLRSRKKRHNPDTSFSRYISDNKGTTTAEPFIQSSTRTPGLKKKGEREREEKMRKKRKNIVDKTKTRRKGKNKKIKKRRIREIVLKW